MISEILDKHNLVLSNVHPFLGDDGKYHFVYVTVNKSNGRFYIGKHSTNTVEDGYLGSGKVLWLAIKKYGYNCFDRYEIKFFNNELESYELEKILVSEEVTSHGKCYNIAVGGVGYSRVGYCCRGSRWVRNQTTREVLRIGPNDEVPDGFVPGRYNDSIWAYNPTTGEKKIILFNEKIPDGFVKGMGKSPKAGGKYFYDMDTKKVIHILPGESTPSGKLVEGYGLSDYRKSVIQESLRQYYLYDKNVDFIEVSKVLGKNEWNVKRDIRYLQSLGFLPSDLEVVRKDSKLVRAQYDFTQDNQQRSYSQE